MNTDPTGPDGPDTPEALLAAHWRKKAKLERSDFDRLLERPCHLDDRGAALGEVIRDVGLEIVRGLPLYHAEFYLAVAAGYLLTTLSYEEFYKTRWHETAGHRAIGPCWDCASCRREDKNRNTARQQASRARRKSRSTPTGEPHE